MDQEKSGPANATEQPENETQISQEAETDISSGASGGDAGDEVAALLAEIETLKTENQEHKEKSLRLMAEMENLRRRTDRDKAEFSKYAISEFARDILSVGDNMRRAIEAVPKEAVAADQVLRSFVEGVEVTEKELLKAFEKYHVKRFDPTGEPFNPHLHDAMTRIEVPNVSADTVVQVIHAGYMIGERVLRPAAVIVAKEVPGADKAAKASGDKDDKAETIPPGAMKVPDPSDMRPREASPPPPPPQGQAGPKQTRVDVQQNVLGRDFQNDRRRQTNTGTGPGAGGGDDRVAQLRRPRSPAGDQSFSEVRSNSGPSGGKPSALHKPVISRKD